MAILLILLDSSVSFVLKDSFYLMEDANLARLAAVVAQAPHHAIFVKVQLTYTHLESVFVTTSLTISQMVLFVNYVQLLTV